ncbi:hypothetical protein [Brunnivagina elsteri]|uniref:Uncharacterized protein n=1 Tax=Brunnivagina elsteri CCALA 953 TaxID=987040 RepID=A0A2A2TKX3_9CYAN|nr:hypothetical protein [Calothrix elsteri]PAX57189.1 hypothetical protein CK510_09105 [Calothrix elsteri CCALA 953]
MAILAIAEKTTLIVAILLVAWSALSFRYAIANGGSIFPASMTTLIFFSIAIAVISIFHFSPLHLIWLLFLSFVIGFVAIMFPLGQQVAIGFLALLAMTGSQDTTQDEDDGEKKESNPIPFDKPKSGIKLPKSRGFG